MINNSGTRSRTSRNHRRELEGTTKRAALEYLRTLLEDNPLTLLTATTDVEHSNATVLVELLREEQS